MATKPPDPPKKAPNLRSDSKIQVASTTRQFDLVPLDSFNSSMFPTNAEVLRRIFYLSDLSNTRSIASIVDQVFTEMKDIYSRGLAIERPTKHEKNCKEQLCKLHKEFRLARTNFKPNKKQYPKVQLFLDNLCKMCDIAVHSGCQE